MSSKSDFSYLLFDDKKVIESTNIKRKALEIVQKRN